MHLQFLKKLQLNQSLPNYDIVPPVIAFAFAFTPRQFTPSSISKNMIKSTPYWLNDNK